MPAFHPPHLHLTATVLLDISLEQGRAVPETWALVMEMTMNAKKSWVDFMAPMLGSTLQLSKGYCSSASSAPDQFLSSHLFPCTGHHM